MKKPSKTRLQTLLPTLLLTLIGLVGLQCLDPPKTRSPQANGSIQARTGVQSLVSWPLPQPVSLETAVKPALASPDHLPDSAYARDVDLGDGRRQVIVSSSPINYQAEDGSWQPIDPRFEVVEEGFVNRANLLQIDAGQRQAVLRLSSGSDPIDWEPLALLLTGADGAETLLARPLDPAQAAPGQLSGGGRAIHYPASWSLAGLAEEVVAGPGQVEQSLILARRPEGQGQILTLRASLRLPPGAALYADSARQTRAFRTEGAVEIRDAAGGATLALAPPRAFEQANPGVGVAGSYRLILQGEGEWQVEVQTPWAWWADPERTYPAVLDPTMKVLQPVTAVSVYQADDPCFWLLYPGDYDGPAVALGCRPLCAGASRVLLRLPMPTLPPEAIIQRAILNAAPVRGYYRPLKDGTLQTSFADLEVRRVLEDWNPTEVSWGNYPDVAEPPLDDGRVVVDPPWLRSYSERPYLYKTFKIQDGAAGPVSDWIEDPSSNYGLELRLADECPAGYDQFVEFPHPSTWDDQDKATGLGGLMGGGFMLHITYIPPNLLDGQPVVQADPLSLPTPAGEEDWYLDTYHAYRPPSSSSWMAVGVKGLDEIVDGPFTYYHAAGKLNLGYSVPFLSGTLMGWSRGESDPPPQPNYLLFESYGSGHLIDPILVDHNDPNHPLNDYLDTYMMEASIATSIPGAPPSFDPYGPFGAAVTYTLRMSTNHMLKAFSLDLVADTWVDVWLSGDWANARLFPPGVQEIWVRGEGIDPESAKEPLSVGEDDLWALVVDYPGFINDPESPVTQTLEITIQVRACPWGTIPAPDGCEVVNCPAAAAKPNGCHTVGTGLYRVCTDAGFTYDAGTNEWTTRRKGADGELYATCVGWQGMPDDRWIVIDHGHVSFAETGTLSLEGDPDSMASLAQFSNPNLPDAMLTLWEKVGFQGYPNAGDPSDPSYGHLDPHWPTDCNYPLDTTDRQNAGLRIAVPAQQAAGEVTLTREIETSPGLPLETFQFGLDWTVQAEGYGDPTTFSYGVSRLDGGSTDVAIGSLTLILDDGWEMDFDYNESLDRPNEGKFTNLRNRYSKIAQPPELGGAWKEVQGLILPTDVGLPGISGGEIPCTPAHCLDLRNSLDDDSRDWDMPDVAVTGTAPPLAHGQPDANGLPPLPHRLLDSVVSVTKDTCPPGGSGDKVTVIEGTGKYLLPGLDIGVSDATFTLCDGQLYDVKFGADLVPPIPVGNSSVFLTYLGGELTLDPNQDNVRINGWVDYEAPAGGALLKSDPRKSTLTVDTAGLFQIRTSGDLAGGLLRYEDPTHLTMAWDPLDAMAQGRVNVNLFPSKFLIGGQTGFHFWWGQGWQNRYWWLPPNSGPHFTGNMSAEFTIKKHAFKIDWSPDPPPRKITLFSFALAFGEFCANSNCSASSWGVQAILDAWYTLWTRIGAYVGFHPVDLDIIIASGGRKLVDQYALVSAATDATTAGAPRTTVADPLADPYLEPYTVTQNVGSLLVGLEWENLARSPELTLIRPDGQEITPANLTSYASVAMTESVGILPARLYGIQDPMLGCWWAKVSNVQGDEGYHLSFHANNRPPQFELLTPSADPPQPQPWTQGVSYTIQWEADPPPPGVSLTLGLYYTVTKPTSITPTGGVIVENLPLLGDGSYDWDTAYLAEGLYQVHARVSSPPRYPPPNPFAPSPPIISGTSQIPGVVTALVPGSIQLSDATPPQAPPAPTLIPLPWAFLVCWEVGSDKDLSGYVLHYVTKDVYGVPQEHQLRVHLDPDPDLPTRQCTRIGGLSAGDTVPVQVAAYDASGNRSDYSPVAEGAVSQDAPSEAPDPGTASGSVGTGHVALISWTGAQTPTLVSHYLLYYAPDGPAGPGIPGYDAVEGSSPIDVGPALSYTLHGLDPGRLYHFAVRAYDVDGRPGPLSPQLSLFLTDGRDDDDDNMPDDWVKFYDLSGPYDDPDGDCLPNAAEWEVLTHPRNPDTDDDLFSDGEEVTAGSDPHDPHDRPDFEGLRARLHLETDQLTFYAGTEDATVPEQVVQLYNYRAGVLTPTASTAAPWLTLRLEDYRLYVGVDQSGLSSGHYTGTLTVSGEAGSCTQDSPQTIAVDLWLYQGDGYKTGFDGLSWWTVDGGGNRSDASDHYTLVGTAGQPDAGLLSGGSYVLSGGFWPRIASRYRVYLPLVLRDR